MLTNEYICVIILANSTLRGNIMSRESKIISAQEFDTQKTIFQYESFGWELLSINGTQITMSRETQNPVYTDLVKHQSQYEDLLAKLRAMPVPKAPANHAPFSLNTWFISLFASFFPALSILFTKLFSTQNSMQQPQLTLQKLQRTMQKEQRLWSKWKALLLKAVASSSQRGTDIQSVLYEKRQRFESVF